MDQPINTETERIPKHVAIIMDGNGRWAQRRNQPRTRGHLEGVKRVEEIVSVARLMGIKVLTLYTFSTENWTRPQKEVSMLMRTLITVLNSKVKSLHKRNIRVQFIGKKNGIPEAVLRSLTAATELTRNNTGLVVNLAFNYGSRVEILEAVRKIAAAVERHEMTLEDINEKNFSSALYTDGLPDPDLLIRTSGEKRISNFLLWQLSYAEFYFTEKFWPEFDEKEFRKAIADYQGRDRRFGNVVVRN
jgi:undecaprenyl diphosphate synthase